MLTPGAGGSASTTELHPPHAPGLSTLDDMLASAGDPSELSNQQIPALRNLFTDETGLGLWLFAKFICGFTRISTTLHWEMCVFLSQWGFIEFADGRRERRYATEGETPEKSWRRLMLCVPRGCFKTSVGTIANTLWVATKNPEATIGIFNEAEQNVKDWIAAMRRILEGSRLYHVLWPERLPPGIHFRDRDLGRSVPRAWKWGDTGFLLPRESLSVPELTVEPFGIGGSHTGKHFTHRILDDIVGEKSATSPAIMEDARHFADHARALERPADSGCELINFTRWAYSDVYQHLSAKHAGEYQVYHRSLLENPVTGQPDVVDGVSIFPTEFPTALCKKMHAADPFVFASQRQCHPKAGRDTAFQKEWVRLGSIELNPNGEPCFRIDRAHYDPRAVHSDVGDEPAPSVIPLSWCDKAILVDPAPSKKGERTAEPRAENGIVVVAEDPWGRMFTLQSVGLREDPVTIMESIIMLAVYWKVHKVGIESVNFSAIYGPLYSALMRYKHPDVAISWIPLEPRGEDKNTRIQRLAAPHRGGLWYYNHERCGHVIQQLLEYPHCEPRDMLDAQAYWSAVLARPQTPTELMLADATSTEWNTGRSALTGY